MNDNRAGWYALYLSITQNISPSRALSIIEGRRVGIRPLSWEQFLAAYRAGEERLAAERLKRSRSEKTRDYQRQYRQLHPLTEEQRARRREYLKAYRARRAEALKRQSARGDGRQAPC